MGKPWDDPEEKLNKKLRKIGRNAAYAYGGAIGLFLLKSLYPKEEGHEKITDVMGDISLMLVMYANVIILTVLFKKKLTPLVASLMTWLVIPAWLIYIFKNAQGF